MPKQVKQVKQEQKQNSEWQEAGKGDVYKFVRRGDTITGIYMGSGSFVGNFGEGKLYRIKTSGGLKIIFGTGVLNQRFADVPIGAEVKVTYLGMEKLKDGNNAHQFEVLYKVIPF